MGYTGFEKVVVHYFQVTIGVYFVLLCIFITSTRCLLAGGRLADYPVPDFRRTFSMSAQEGRQSYREIEHNYNSLPFLVRVQSTARIGDSAGYRFEGVGACQNSGEKGNYGGLLFGYSTNSIRIWAPSEYRGNENGRIIFVGDGWGGEKYTESAVAADVTVEAWKTGPEPTFQTEIEVDTRRETYYEVVHGLNQIPELVSVRVSSLNLPKRKAFYFHGVSSSQNPTKIRHYGGVIFSYNETAVRLWFPDRGMKKGKTGCIMIARGWGGGVNSDELSSSACRVEIRLWVNLFPPPAFQTDWMEMRANAHNKSFLEIPHYLNRLPLYVQVQIRVIDNDKVNSIFEGTGSIQATQFSRKSYGAVLFAYNDKKVRIWTPSSESNAFGRIILVSGGWGSKKRDMEFDTAHVRVRLFVDKCDGVTQVVDSQGLCREAAEIGLSLQVSPWQKCSNTCGKGTASRYLTGCYGQSLQTVLQCGFEDNMCGFTVVNSPEYQLQWKRTQGHDVKKENGQKSAKFEPLYGYPKGSFFLCTETTQPDSKGLLLSPSINKGKECILRFSYTTGVYFGLLYIEVQTVDQKWHIVWKAIDSQTGNPKAWFGGYINIYTLVKDPIIRFRFVHEMPEKCGHSCGYQYVAIDALHLECLSEHHQLFPIATCQEKSLPFPGCPIDPTQAMETGPAYSTVITKHGRFIMAARNKSDLIAVYNFKVVKRGKYFLWVEGFGQSKQDNGVRIQLNNHTGYFWNLIIRNDTPVWNVFALGYNLKPGVHRVRLFQYEFGFKFRNLMVAPASLTTWTDLGMQSHHISDHMLTSSLYSMTLREEAQFSRLHGLGGWRPRDENAGVLYLQLRLPDLALINRIATQGGYSFDTAYRHRCFTASFKVKFSLDGINYAYYRSLKTGNEYMFRGNSDYSTVKYHNLSYAVPARGVRFYPWKFPLYPCLRVELYGKYITSGMCEHVADNPELQKPCFGDRNCGKNSMCQRKETADDGEKQEEETCECISGYHGNKCQHAGCKPNPCENNGVCQVLKGKFKCFCPAGYYGKTCSFKCPQGKYGRDCSKTCSCPGFSSCDHMTGKCSCKPGYIGEGCITPCADGFYGDECKYRCICGMLPVCDHTSGACYCQLGYHGTTCKRECPKYYFGRNCTESCQCLNDAACHGHNGQCICTPGWHGNQCELPCPVGTYGEGCKHTCSCSKNADCHHITGKCSCKPGWIGKNCTKPCPLGNYGAGCMLACHCNWEKTKSCHPVTGECQCLPGYTGGNCSAKCPTGTFGPGCSQKCMCVNDAKCDHVTGACRCQIGYIGKYCERRCKVGYYGEQCRHKCNCITNQTEECDFKTGECNCRAGYRGNKCHRTCKKGTWGRNCGNKCHCLNNGTCEGVDGLCFCAPGWEGMICGKQCIQGFYGPDCKEKCRCQNNAYCDRFNGSCTCRRGFMGEFCEDSCKEGTYGPYCKFKCPCNKKGTQKCDAETGRCHCKLGWHGKKCEKECPDGHYGLDCIDRCFPCQHISGPCDKRYGNCSCASGFYGYHCQNDCDKGFYGYQCQSKCYCATHSLCNSIDGSCFSPTYAVFTLAFYDRYDIMMQASNQRLLRSNVEIFMRKYFFATKALLNETGLLPKRSVRSLSNDWSLQLTQRQRRGLGGKNLSTHWVDAGSKSVLYFGSDSGGFVARIVDFYKKVDPQGRDVTEAAVVVFYDSVPMNGTLISRVFAAVSEDKVIEVLRYSYYSGPVYDSLTEKEKAFSLLWIIAGGAGALVALLLAVIIATLYQRRHNSSPPIYKVKRNSKDLEMKPCLPGSGGHVLAFDNPYYDVIAAMGLDDDIEEDYHNPLYPLYDDASYYGEGQESCSETEIAGDEIYHYPYDRDSGISSGTF